MDYLANYLPSNNILALVIASIIFIVTVALVAKKLISFLITIVLLFFAIASGMAIANNDLVRDFLKQHTTREARPVPVVTEPQKPEQSLGETVDQIRDEVGKLLNQLAELLKTHEANQPAKDPEANRSPSQE